MSTDARASGLSLWLMPQGRARHDLAALIEGIAQRLGTESFAPHVTLLPGLAAPVAEVVERTRALAAGLPPMTLELLGVDGLDQHFRCLFFRIALDPALRRARSSAALRFGRDPERPFDPHLSLVYGRLEEAAKAGLKRELSGRVPPRFEARRLHVWRTEGPVGEWGEVGAFGLGSRSDD